LHASAEKREIQYSRFQAVKIEHEEQQNLDATKKKTFAGRGAAVIVFVPCSAPLCSVLQYA
jgi:hypothetical protein